MASSTPEDKGPMEETTIHRGVQPSHGKLIMTFSHRQCWSVGNYAAPWVRLAGTPGAGQIAPVFYRPPFYVLPLRSVFFWMTYGELALFTQAYQMRFLHADMNIHHSSFRSQFITGSSAVGFANSNMQLHGLIYESGGNLPPYEVLKSGDPLTAPVVLAGQDIASATWQPLGDSATAVCASNSFQSLTWTPWFHLGWLPPTDDSAVPPLNNMAGMQTMFPMVEKAQIMGRKVMDWNKSFDLQSQWGGRWIPVKPNFINGSAYGQDFTTNTPSTLPGFAFTVQALINNGRNGAGTAQIDIDDMWIVPPDPFTDMVRNQEDRHTAVDDPPVGVATEGSYNKHKKGIRLIDNLFVGIEHLPNPDGSMVPAIWDMYIDTNITVELDFSAQGYHPGAAFSQYKSGVYAAGNTTKYMQYVSLEPLRYQCVNNTGEQRFTMLKGTDGSKQPTALPQSSAGTSSFGSREAYQTNSRYFNVDFKT